MDVALWFGALCGLVVMATLATARARATPDAVIGRSAFLAVALAHAIVIAGAIWVWGGTDASYGRDAQLRRGPRVTLELRAVHVPVDRPIAVGHDAASDVRVPGHGSAKIAEVSRDKRGIVVTVACPPATFVLPPGATLAVSDCTTPAFTLRAEAGRVAIAPAGKPARTTLRAGDVVRIGRDDEPVPGLATWELPSAGAEIVAVPTDPTDCAAWSPHAGQSAGACELSLGAFELTAVPIVADPEAVIGRNARAALAVGLPLLLACLVFAASARSRRRAPALAHVLRLAVVAGGFAGLVCWRLLWAYRIDVLRDLSPAGARLADNGLEAALIGATLAGIAARRTSFALVAWAGWLAITWFALDLGQSQLTTARCAMIGLSIVAVFAPRAGELRRPTVTPELVLAAIGAAAVAARLVAPHGVLFKLALAYALVLAGHAGLRAALAPEVAVRRRVGIALALTSAALALAAYDTGVTVAIGAIGLSLALLVGYHDAIYDASRANRIGILEREHAQLIAVHGAVAVALGVAAIAGAYLASDRAWLEHGVDVACHAPLVAFGLFAFGAAFARAYRRAWIPHVLAAVAALAVWGARGEVLERATAGHGVISDRVASVIDPGYALLHDGHRFAATASAWREAVLPDAGTPDRWHGEGLFGARIVDPGVVHSVENDYLPVLVARETGMAGIAQTTLLVLLLVAAAGAFASAAHRHASRAHRSRWLVAVVIGVLAMYQPLASLGVLPLTGISWPGFGIDSPSDLWLFVIAIAWCVLGAEDHGVDDERVRKTARVIRARRIALAALATTACAGGIVVARSASVALARVPADDARIAAALDYGPSVACPWREQRGALSALVPASFGGTPTDAGTTRFDRELRATYAIDRSAALGALQTCTGTAGHWRFSRAGDTCTAVFHAGGPELRLAIAKDRATCSIAGDDEPAIAVRGRGAAQRGPRIRVVSEPLGAAALDAGELIVGGRIIRLRAGAPAVELATAAPGLARAGKVALGGGAAIEAAQHGLVLHGDAALFAMDSGGWRQAWHARDVALDHMSLVVAGAPEHRVVVQIRPANEALLADDVDRMRRTYPYGNALPELGWVNPFELDHSLGLDGWIHAALAHPATRGPACGTLTPPATPRDHVCAASRLDGVMECKVALQPELALALDELADALAGGTPVAKGKPAAIPTRIAFVLMRGDTGEILAQQSRVPGREPLAYAPATRDAEAALVKLREQHGESDRERVEWNLPIAVGSTFKAIVARAAEQAFPDQLHALTLTAAGHASGCKAHRGSSVAPLLGHCPPTSLAGELVTADVHEFLAHSPNWYQAALGLVGLALPAGRLSTKAGPLTFEQVVGSDLTSWPTSTPLAIDDATGPIVQGHRLVVAGLRRTQLWTHVEALLGRPLCTLGDHASCVRVAERNDVCAARALPIDAPSRDLRYLVALGPDRLEVFDGDAPGQTRVPVREYFQLLRGAGAHPIGSLAQLADAFSRVVYGNVAASWFPTPATGTLPTWSCSDTADRTTNVLGAGGGLCAVVREGTARGALAAMLADPRIKIYGAKTGTTDSLAEVARQPELCAAWNASHPAPLQLTCGKRPPDDSLFVISFGVVTATGTVPLTLAIQLQRGGMTSAARATPAFLDAIAKYFAGP